MSVRLYAPGTRKGNRYWIARVTVDGRRAEVSTAAADATAARRWAREFERRLREDRPPRPGEAVSFARAADAYLAYRDPSDAERKRVERLKAALGRRIVGELRQADLVEAALQLQPRSIASSRNREVIGPASAILHYAARNGWCERRPVERFHEAAPKTRAMSIPAATALVQAASDPDLRLLLVWLFRQGDRISDALRVSWADLDLQDATVRMRIGKTDRWRTAAVHHELVAMLGNRTDKEGRVFRWQTKSGVYKPLRALCERIGIKMTPHMARHSMATWMVSAGVNLRTIMAAGGWKDVKSVVRYAASDVEEVRAAGELLPRFDAPQQSKPRRGRVGEGGL
jgi:site-specific recombinase XerD